jgi:hypothetical protein
MITLGITLVACVATYCLGWLACDRRCRAQWRADGWLEHYFSEAARDRKRRDRLGRFTVSKADLPNHS